MGNDIKMDIAEMDSLSLKELEKYLHDIFSRPDSYYKDRKTPMRTKISVYINDDAISVKITNGFHSILTGIGGLEEFIKIGDFIGDFDVFKVNEKELTKEEVALFMDYHTGSMTSEELKKD